ncbi:hypothetical protein ACFWVC_04485 [Streptomyces sp. NPDC058691]
MGMTVVAVGAVVSGAGSKGVSGRGAIGARLPPGIAATRRTRRLLFSVL